MKLLKSKRKIEVGNERERKAEAVGERVGRRRENARERYNVSVR